MLTLLVLLAGCKDAAMEEENSPLKLRIADLERANERLEKDHAALTSQLKSAREAQEAIKRNEALAALGVSGSLTAVFHTSLGVVRCQLRPAEAPETVANFVQLAQGKKEWINPEGNKTTSKLYDGTIFHRVIPGFMIQGGDPLGNGTGGPGYEFADEVGSFTVFDKPGLLAMANSGPNTNGSQFFITEGTPTHLNGRHTIFGDCGDLDVVAKIAQAPKGANDRPKTDVVLQRVEIQDG